MKLRYLGDIGPERMRKGDVREFEDEVYARFLLESFPGKFEVVEDEGDPEPAEQEPAESGDQAEKRPRYRKRKAADE